METKDMNKGVQILLERMNSNPEEFYTDETKWLDLLGMVINRAKQLAGERPLGFKPLISSCCLTDDEVIVLHTKMQQIQANEFTNRVMERLLGSDERLTSNTGGTTAVGTFSYSNPTAVILPTNVINSPSALAKVKALLKGSKV
jgi:hypothetical protein